MQSALARSVEREKERKSEHASYAKSFREISEEKVFSFCRSTSQVPWPETREESCQVGDDPCLSPPQWLPLPPGC